MFLFIAWILARVSRNNSCHPSVRSHPYFDMQSSLAAVLPSWLRWYKKPEYRDIKEYATAVGSGKRALSPDGRSRTSIPKQLKLERVLDNKTCMCLSLSLPHPAHWHADSV